MPKCNMQGNNGNTTQCLKKYSNFLSETASLMAGRGNGFEVVSVHDSLGKWSTNGLKMEPLKELATNPIDLAGACAVHYSCV